MAFHTDVQIQHKANASVNMLQWCREYELLVGVRKHFPSKGEWVHESDGAGVDLRILRTEQGVFLLFFNWCVLRRAR